MLSSKKYPPRPANHPILVTATENPGKPFIEVATLWGEALGIALTEESRDATWGPRLIEDLRTQARQVGADAIIKLQVERNVAKGIAVRFLAGTEKESKDDKGEPSGAED